MKVGDSKSEKIPEQSMKTGIKLTVLDNIRNIDFRLSGLSPVALNEKQV